MGGLNIGIIERNRPTPISTRILVYLTGIVKGGIMEKLPFRIFIERVPDYHTGANGIIIRVHESKYQYAKNIKQALFALNELTYGYEFIEGET